MRSEAQVLRPAIVVVTIGVVNLESLWNVLPVLHHPDNAVLEVLLSVDLHAAIIPFWWRFAALPPSGWRLAD